jgi:hypothetical protein
MKVVAFLIIACLQVVAVPSAGDLVRRIQAKTPVEAILPAVEVAGKYSYPPEEIRKRAGPPMSGNDLYLFPDKTYVYCEWGDILPNTIYDKGNWSFSKGILDLKSDLELPWNTDPDWRFLVVHRSSHADEILLVEIESLPYFEKKAGRDPEFMLLLVAKQRESVINATEGPQLKVGLMREAWKPDSFQKTNH